MQSVVVLALLAVSANAFLFGNPCSPCGGGFPGLGSLFGGLFPQPAPAYPSYQQPAYSGYAQPTYQQQPVYQPQPAYQQQAVYQPQPSYSAPAPSYNSYVSAPQTYQQPQAQVYQPQPEPVVAPAQTYSSYSAPAPVHTGYQIPYADLVRGRSLGYHGYRSVKYLQAGERAPYFHGDQTNVPEQVAPVVHAENGYVQPAAEVQPLPERTVVVERTEVTAPVYKPAVYEPTPVVESHVERNYEQPAAQTYQTRPQTVNHVVEEKHVETVVPNTPEEAGY